MIIYPPLDAKPLCIFLKMKGPSLMLRKDNVFLSYGQDEFGYRFYALVEKKLVRSRDVVFMKDQTIQDILKIDTPIP